MCRSDKAESFVFSFVTDPFYSLFQSSLTPLILTNDFSGSNPNQRKGTITNVTTVIKVKKTHCNSFISINPFKYNYVNSSAFSGCSLDFGYCWCELFVFEG